MMVHYSAVNKHKPRYWYDQFIGWEHLGRTETMELAGAQVTCGGQTTTTSVVLVWDGDEHGNGNLSLTIGDAPTTLHIACMCAIHHGWWLPSAAFTIADGEKSFEVRPSARRVTHTSEETGVRLTFAGFKRSEIPWPVLTHETPYDAARRRDDYGALCQG
jgi:hypothetical protein